MTFWDVRMSCQDRSLGFIADEISSLSQSESTCGKQSTHTDLFLFTERWDRTDLERMVSCSCCPQEAQETLSPGAN